MTVIVCSKVLQDQIRLELEQYLLTQSSDDSKGVETNMKSGYSFFENKWLSPNDIHTRDALNGLTKVILERADDIAARMGESYTYKFLSCSAVVSRKGMRGKAHSHQGALSGVYYVNAGSSGAEDGGEFFMHKDKVTKHTPKTDQMLLFSSKLKHSVSQYTGDEVRVIVSFNLVVNKEP